MSYDVNLLLEHNAQLKAQLATLSTMLDASRETSIFWFNRNCEAEARFKYLEARNTGLNTALERLVVRVEAYTRNRHSLLDAALQSARVVLLKIKFGGESKEVDHVHG